MARGWHRARDLWSSWEAARNKSDKEKKNTRRKLGLINRFTFRAHRQPSLSKYQPRREYSWKICAAFCGDAGEAMKTNSIIQSSRFVHSPTQFQLLHENERPMREPPRYLGQSPENLLTLVILFLYGVYRPVLPSLGPCEWTARPITSLSDW